MGKREQKKRTDRYRKALQLKKVGSEKHESDTWCGREGGDGGGAVSVVSAPASVDRAG